MVQRLLEIDTYRLMALLTLPVAQGLTPWLTDAERELAKVSASLVDATEANEPALLDQLTRLEAQIESRESSTTTVSRRQRPTTGWCSDASRNCARYASTACRISRSSRSGGWRRR